MLGCEWVPTIIIMDLTFYELMICTYIIYAFHSYDQTVVSFYILISFEVKSAKLYDLNPVRTNIKHKGSWKSEEGGSEKEKDEWKRNIHVKREGIDGGNQKKAKGNEKTKDLHI